MQIPPPRKILFYAIVFFFSLGLSAQTVTVDDSQPDGTYSPEYVFANLDFSALQTGLLIDKAIPLANLDFFSGQATNLAVANPTRVQMVYAMLMSAATDLAAMPTPDALGRAAQIGTDFPFKIVLYEYDQLKTNAVTSGLIQVSNNQLQDIYPASQSPYVVKKVLAAAPWFTGTLKENEAYTFKIDLQSNMNADIQDISLDMGSGFISISSGQEVHFSPGPSSLSADFNLRVTLQSGEILYSQSQLPVELNVSAITPDGYGGSFTIPVTSDLPNPFDGETDRMSIVTACEDSLIRRPLLVINGFEAPRLLDFFGTTFDDIIGEIGFFSPTGNRMIDDFLSSGYDIIFLDFRDETAAIEHNADVVKQAIRIINTMKVTNEEIYCIGISLGGVLGKLALREMELDGEDHQTRQFVSVDSPLRGANIPFGFRKMLEHVAGLGIGPFGAGATTVGDQVGILGDAIATLESPAVQQLLVYHHPAYWAFYDYFTGLGALEYCEHLTISNGSQIGLGQSYDAGERMFKAQGSSGSLLAQEIGINPGIGGFAINFITSFIGTGARFKAEFWALPDGNEAKVYKGRFFASFSFVPIVWHRRKVTISGTQPMDTAPGGMSSLGDGMIDLDGVDMFHPDFCFIPSVSSLEVGPFKSIDQPLSDPFEDISDNDAVLALPETNMQAIVAVDDNLVGAGGTFNNQEHATFSTDNTGVLLSTMLNGETLTGDVQSRVFNFGDSHLEYDYSLPPPNPWPVYRTEPIIDIDLSIFNNGKLWINGGDRLGFTDLANPLNNTDSAYDVYITSGYCSGDAVTVTVDGGGLIEVGDWNNAVNKGRLHVLEDATLNMIAGGKVNIEHESGLIVEEGAAVNVKNGGQLFAEFGGKIIIKRGGILTIKTGGTLRLSQDSELKIQDGGQLIIEDDAKIQLWDGTTVDGRAVIIVKGTLQIKNEFDFSGNGYFDFFPSYKLELKAGHFKLKGEGQETRFIHIQAGVQVNFEGNDLKLEEGRIAYEDGSAIKIGIGAELTLSETKHTGSMLATGIIAEGISRFRVVASIFEELETGIEIYGFATPNAAIHSMIIKSKFTNCETALQIDNSDQMYITNSIFEGGIYAMLFNKLGTARLRNTEIFNYTNPTPSSIEDWGAIELRDVPEFDMSGGSIHDNDVGIFAPKWNEAGDLNQSNILLRNKATISNHSNYGIFMAKGGVDDNGLDYGLVLMDCAKLLDNTVGIGGRDVLLQIDAIDNSGTDIPEKLRSNHFRNPVFGDLFAICYDDRDDIFEVSARGNYWFDGDIETNIQSMHNLQNAHSPDGCVGFYPSVTVDVSNFVSEPSEKCPKRTIEDPDPPQDCDLVKTDGTILGSSVGRFGLGSENGGNYQNTSHYYNDAYLKLVAALDDDSATDAAKDQFAKLADVLEIERDQADTKCQKNVDVARILVVKSYDKPNENLRIPTIGNFTNHSNSKSLLMKVYPNPSKGIVWIEIGQPTGYIELFNSLGQKIKTIQIKNRRLQIDLNHFESGLFYFKWNDSKGTLLKTGRVIHLK